MPKFLTKEEKMNLARLALAGDELARNAFVLNMLQYLHKIANRYDSKVDHEDLVHHAFAVVLEKFHMFDPDRGVCPMTYFGCVAERQMQLLANVDGVIKVPPSTNTDSQRENRERAASAMSLEYLMSGGFGPTELGETLADDSKSVPDQASERETARAVRRLMKTLPDRDRLVVELRVVKGMSLREVGGKLGISKERVRQIQYRAMKRLREEKFPA